MEDVLNEDRAKENSSVNNLNGNNNALDVTSIIDSGTKQYIIIF